MAIQRTNRREIIESKQLRDSMARFGVAMEGLSKNVTGQTEVLNQMLSLQLEEMKKKEREEELARVRETEEKERERKKREDEAAKKKEKGGWSLSVGVDKVMDMKAGWMSLLGKGSLALLAPIAAESIKNIVTSGLEKLGTSDDFALAVGENIGSSIGWGMVGTIFGRKIGLAFAAGSMLWNVVDDKMDLGSHIQTIGDKLGFELSPYITDALGTSISSLLLLYAPTLLRRSIMASISGAGAISRLAITAATTAGPAIASALVAGSKIAIGGMMRFLPVAAAAGIVALYSNYGDQASAWLTEHTGTPVAWSDAAVQATSYAAAGATLGMMFGPQGAIIGGVVGLVASLGLSVWKWFKGREEEAKKAAEAAAADVDNQIAMASGERNASGSLPGIMEVQERTNTRGFALADAAGRNMEVNSLAAPIQNFEGVSKDEQIRRSQAITSSIDELISSYDNSDAKRDELMRAMHNLYAMKAEIDRKDAELGSRDPSIAPELRNMIKSKGRRLRNFAMEAAPEETAAVFGQDGEIPKFRTGTKGFQDFGTESIALLHGKEAVVPDGTDAAMMLKKHFNDDWSSKMRSIQSPDANARKSKMKILEQSAQESTASTIIAPTTYAPVTTVHKGNSVNNSRFTSIGGSASDLDFGLPRGAL